MKFSLPGNKLREIEFETLEECPYCSSKKIKFLFKAPDRLTNLPGEFSLYKCQNCDLVFLNPRVKEESIKLLYSDELGYYKLKETTQIKNILYLIKKFLYNQTLINHFNYKLGRKRFLFYLLTFPFRRILKTKSIPVFRDNGCLLEIGCSHGGFLEKMAKLGWKVKGIEMHEKSALHAMEKRGLDIISKKVEECNFREEFDAIVMNMLLEHLYDPFKNLEIITTWLKSEGQLIFSIPYFEGVEFKWFKRHCYGLHLPFHITFPNKKIIEDYLEKLGYQKIEFYHHSFDRDIVASSHYKYQDTKSVFYKVLAYNKFLRFVAIKPFVLALAFLGRTSRVTVRAIKK